MRAWWSGLSPRERGLIAVAGGLALILGMWLLVVSPILNARVQAERSYVDSARMLAEVRAGSELMRALRPNPQEGDERRTSLRGAVAESAQRFGIQVTRVQPLDSGSVNVVIEETPPGAVLSWIMALHADYDVTVSKASMNRRAVGGTVNANLMLSTASAS